MPDRYYFGKDGTLLIQYAAPREGHVAGEVVEGKWSVDGYHLCLEYQEQSGKKSECFVFNKDKSVIGPWGIFDDFYHVHSIGGSRSFFLNRWMYGNMILKPDAWRAIKNGSYTGLSPEDYKEDITGKIMRLPLGLVYHHDNGTAYWLNTEKAKLVAENPSRLEDPAFIEQQKIGKSSWSVEGVRHCWTYSSNNKVCNTAINGKDAYVPHGGYFQIMDDNFIRQIKPEDLIETK